MNTGPYPPPQGNNNQPPMYQGPYQQPPYPLYNVPPPQQRRRGLWPWYKRQTGLAKVGLGCGLIVAILLLCTCSLAAFASRLPPVPASPSPQVVATKAQPTATSVPLATPTATLVPTATPTPKPRATAIKNAGPAVLGGTVDAFIAKFGPPNDHSSEIMPHFNRCGNSNIDQVILLQNPAGGTSGRIIAVTAQACTTTSWNMSLAKVICSSYFPADAVYKRTVQVGTTSIDKIYFSATLAHEFTPDSFTDANGNPVQPGLFDVNYLYASNTDTTYIDSCDVDVGTQQTQ